MLTVIGPLASAAAAAPVGTPVVPRMVPKFDGPSLC